VGLPVASSVGPVEKPRQNQRLNQAGKALKNVPPDLLEAVVQHVESLGLKPRDQEERLKVALENVHFYYEKIHPHLMEHPEPTVQDVVDILVDSCLVEKNFSEGMEWFVRKTFERGLEIEMDQEQFRRWVEKLGNLRMYRKVINAMGLAPFEEQLMSYEMQKILIPGIAAPPPPPKKGNKE
jgi:hypothetical protein